MRNKIVVFTGPTLNPDEGSTILDAVYLPPAKQGDIYSAIQYYQPNIIALIDGNFENVPAPWHKEILYALSIGVQVYGSSSMGALRASELHTFGMIGVGQIFEDFKNGFLTDDDEVTVAHGPSALNYPLLSDAMVNIRYGLKLANKNQILTEKSTEILAHYFKSKFYKERSFARHYSNLMKGKIIPSIEIKSFYDWLAHSKFDLKKADAFEMLRILNTVSKAERNDRGQPSFEFQHTLAWDGLIKRCNQKIEENKNKNKNENTLSNVA